MPRQQNKFTVGSRQLAVHRLYGQLTVDKATINKQVCIHQMGDCKLPTADCKLLNTASKSIYISKEYNQFFIKKQF
jgi:hypothetical protein